MIERLRADLKIAMKAKDQAAVNALRLLMSDIGKAEVNAGKPLAEGDELAIVRKSVRSRMESIEQFRAAGRNDLLEKEEAELKIIERYAPQGMDEDATRKIVEKTIAEMGAASRKDFGKVMGKIMAQHKGVVDAELVKRLVTEKLP